MKISTPELLVDAHAFLGEGSAWDAAHNRLYWIDIFAGHLHIFDPHNGTDEVLSLGKLLTFVAPTRSGNIIAGLVNGLGIYEFSSSKIKYLADPESHLPGNRFNDGKCGPDGRLLAGTMDNSEVLASGSLYSLTPGKPLKTLQSGIGISNGLTWSPDGSILYYIDTPTHQVQAFDYDLSSGEIANPRVVVDVPEAMGWPDGMTSDSIGNLWVALWGGAAISIWDPITGTLVQTLPIPAKNVTSCAFGGPAGNELYVTSARKGVDKSALAAYPATGGLFRLVTSVTGTQTFVYAD